MAGFARTDARLLCTTDLFLWEADPARDAFQGVVGVSHVVVERRGGNMNVIFISMDTLRADHLGCLGYERMLTPNLDRIAREGALFTNAFASDIPTQPSHTAIFTG